MEYKNLPQFTKSINGRTVTGVFAVHGNMDNGGDISVNGAFSKRLADSSRKRARFLWNHDGWQPPIASIKSIREIGRDELPEKVLEYAPDATGGVEVTREYYENVELANWVLSGIKAGDIDEMSYAYDVHEYSREERNGKDVRVLKDIEIFDISDVNWGMNPATAGAKGIGSGQPFVMHSETVGAAVKGLLARIQERKDFREKAGRVLSETNRTMIKNLVLDLTAVSDSLNTLLIETEPKADHGLVLGALAEFERLQMELRNI